MKDLLKDILKYKNTKFNSGAWQGHIWTYYAGYKLFTWRWHNHNYPTATHQGRYVSQLINEVMCKHHPLWYYVEDSDMTILLATTAPYKDRPDVLLR